MKHLSTFIEKYQLARQSALESKPQGGLCGFELEWNLLDHQFQPLLTVGSGPDEQSFVDYLRADCLAPWSRPYSQLEVYNWMIEWATRPYYDPHAAVYEARLMEGLLMNSLARAGEHFGEHLYYWPGNLLVLPEISHASIPRSWNLAKRRYLERCVDLYGEALATAGIHTNLSLPDPLFQWDFMHLPASERGGVNHVDNFKSQFYITATRLMRAFAALFIATSASTPLQSQQKDGRPVVVLTEFDSVRNLTFPNPANLDLPDLYRSYSDYLRNSYDLIQRGVRFGNNNWTPVRARSFAEPVERLIAITSDQLHDLYARGLYAAGRPSMAEEMAHQIEIHNLMERINLPMSRVEIRTDESGHSLELDVANLVLKHLLMLRFYADQEFARAFRYDREDIARARKNELETAKWGLRAEIENPFTGKQVEMRDFLRWTLEQVRPLAAALGFQEDLKPLNEMALGAPNTAQRLRTRLSGEVGAGGEVPLEVLQLLAEEHEAQLVREIETIAQSTASFSTDSARLAEFVQRARDDVYLDVNAPVRFRARANTLVEMSYTDKTSEILDLAQALVRIPSVTTGTEERLEEVRRAAAFILDYVRDVGLNVHYFDQDKYPALLINFPGQVHAPVMLSGHFDVVPPEPDESQFQPRIEGDYLWGRGAADMKTVVATYLVWMKDMLRQGGTVPPVNLLLVGNEENGETEPMGTPHALAALPKMNGNGLGINGLAINGLGINALSTSTLNSEVLPKILIAGERTGEKGNELWGEVCIKNRGVMRFEVRVTGQRTHSSMVASGASAGSQQMPGDLTERLMLARSALTILIGKHFTLSSTDGWKSQASFPYIQVGTPGMYNVTAGSGVLGVEVRPIPEDRLEAFHQELQDYCVSQGLDLAVSVMENGIACDEHNPYLTALLCAVQEASGQEFKPGRKLPGTSARFAPLGQGVVWGQSGIGPHAKDERHFIPSILPYYQALQAYARILSKK